MTRPKILVTLDTGVAERRGVPFPQLHVKQAYIDAVESAGGLALPVAPTDAPGALEAFVELMDGLVVTGGSFDIPPEAYGAAQTARRVDATKPTRTRFEAHLVRAALDRRRPVLGICGGMQLLNVVLGGSLVQDIAEAVPGALEHEQPTSPARPDHPVHLEPGAPLAAWVGLTQIAVNTTHHQAVDRLGDGLEVWGRAPDGVIEAIGLRGRPEVCGVQWHPELLADPVSAALYGALVEAAGEPR